MKYGFEYTSGLVLLGTVIVFPLVPSFALIAVVIIALVAVAALAALAGAVLATPYLLVRSFRRHFAERRHIAERRHSAERSAQGASAVLRAAGGAHS